MDVSVYVIHSKSSCPERSEWASVLLTDVRKHMVEKGIKCKLSSILSTVNSNRYQLHLQALQAASKGKHCTAVFEDDTILFQNMGDIFSRFSKSGDDIWYLTPSKTAYFIKGESAARLLKHVNNPSVTTTNHRDIIVRCSADMYMSVKSVQKVCEDGSRTGIWIPTLVPNKPCVTGVPDDMTVDTTAKWWKTHPHPYTALSYAKALRDSGDFKKSLCVCDTAIAKFSKYPDCRGDTDLLTFAIELYKQSELRIQAKPQDRML